MLQEKTQNCTKMYSNLIKSMNLYEYTISLFLDFPLVPNKVNIYIGITISQ